MNKRVLKGCCKRAKVLDEADFHSESPIFLSFRTKKHGKTCTDGIFVVSLYLLRSKTTVNIYETTINIYKTTINNNKTTIKINKTTINNNQQQ